MAVLRVEKFRDIKALSIFFAFVVINREKVRALPTFKIHNEFSPYFWEKRNQSIKNLLIYFIVHLLNHYSRFLLPCLVIYF